MDLVMSLVFASSVIFTFCDLKAFIFWLQQSQLWNRLMIMWTGCQELSSRHFSGCSYSCSCGLHGGVLVTILWEPTFPFSFCFLGCWPWVCLCCMLMWFQMQLSETFWEKRFIQLPLIISGTLLFETTQWKCVCVLPEPLVILQSSSCLSLLVIFLPFLFSPLQWKFVLCFSMVHKLSQRGLDISFRFYVWFKKQERFCSFSLFSLFWSLFSAQSYI